MPSLRIQQTATTRNEMAQIFRCAKCKKAAKQQPGMGRILQGGKWKNICAACAKEKKDERHSGTIEAALAPRKPLTPTPGATGAVLTH